MTRAHRSSLSIGIILTVVCAAAHGAAPGASRDRDALKAALAPLPGDARAHAAGAARAIADAALATSRPTPQGAARRVAGYRPVRSARPLEEET